MHIITISFVVTLQCKNPHPRERVFERKTDSWKSGQLEIIKEWNPFHYPLTLKFLLYTTLHYSYSSLASAESGYGWRTDLAHRQNLLSTPTDKKAANFTMQSKFSISYSPSLHSTIEYSFISIIQIIIFRMCMFQSSDINL